MSIAGISIVANTTTAKTTYLFLLDDLVKSTPSTSRQSVAYIQPSSSTSEAVATPGYISSVRSYNSMSPEDDTNELEWHNIVNTPRVRNALRRLAVEARRQAATGEIEEGGFAIE